VSAGCGRCLQVFLLGVRRLCGAIEVRLSHSLPPWLRAGRQRVINLEYSAMAGN